MADPAPGEAASQPDPNTQKISLKILSPGNGVPETIEINEVPTNIPISALKSRITVVSPSHPSADHQRLIYQGRVLANAAASLADVFGPEALRNHNSFTIHLVVRPSASSSPNPLLPPQNSTPANGPQAAVPPPPQPNVLPNPAFAAPIPRAPTLQPRVPGFQRPHIPGFPQGQFPQGQFPQIPGMPQGQFPHIPGMPQGGFPQIPGMPPGAFPYMPGMPQGPFPQMMAMPPGQHQAQNMGAPTFNAQTAQQSQSPVGPAVPTATANSTPAANAHGQRGFAQAGPSFQQLVAQQQALRAAIGQQGVGAVASGAPLVGQTQQESSQATGPASDANATGNASQIPHTGPPQGLGAVQGALPHNMRYQMTINHATFAIPAGQAMHGPNQQNLFPQPFPFPQFQGQQAQMPVPPPQFAGGHMFGIPQQVPTGLTQGVQPGQTQGGEFTSDANSASTVYVLSSPNGPHAILFSPQGLYGTAPQSSMLQHGPPIPGQHNMLSSFVPSPTSGSTAVRQVQADAEANGNLERTLPEMRAELQQLMEARQPIPEQRANDAAEGGVLGPIQPFLAHFWLLLRVLLFAYFFLGGGQGWRRPMIMVAICLAFLLLRGFGAGAGVREAVRGWWEGVVGLPTQRQQTQQANPANAGVIPVQQPGGQQEQRALSPLRARLRPVERALALFLASLWPGVGERTVRARREEDARLLRERQEAEVRARQQALQAQEEATAVAADDAGQAEGQSQELAEAPVDAVSSSADVGTEHSGQVRERHQAPLDGAANEQRRVATDC